jgi:hypothetical protein
MGETSDGRLVKVRRRGIIEVSESGDGECTSFG